ncbi:MAG: MarR family winged helix-turn-helix transcriptional regulator [Candidatus Xenobia bacterium]
MGQMEDKRIQYYNERCRVSAQRYAEFDRPSVEVLLQLLYTHDVVMTAMGRSYSAHGLSDSAFNVLMILRSSPGGLPLSELGALLLVSRANVTGLVDCLVQKGLVERATDDKDRRIRIARIQPAGEALLEELLPSHYELIRELLADLGTDEKRQIVELLHKLRLSVGGRTHKAPVPSGRRLDVDALKGNDKAGVQR